MYIYINMQIDIIYLSNFHTALYNILGVYLCVYPLLGFMVYTVLVVCH